MGYLKPDQVSARQGRTTAGAPVAGTTEVQTVTVTGTPTGGTFKLEFKGQRTGTIAYNAAASAVQTALRALSTISGSNVTVTGSAGGPFTVTFAGDLAKKALPLLTLKENALTGGTAPSVTVVEATPGVDASHRGARTGETLTDTTNKKVYVNTGTATVPVWTELGEEVTPTSAPAALTVADGVGTNDSTIGAITADASVIAAIQELAAKVNAFRTALLATGVLT